MLKKRLLTAIIAGALVAGIIRGGSIAVHATEEDEINDSVSLDGVLSDADIEDSESALEDIPDVIQDGSETDNDEAGTKVQDELTEDDPDVIEDDAENSADQIEDIDDSLLESGALSDENIGILDESAELFDDVYAVDFYPGEGKLISSLDFGDDISGWEYDTSTGVMTLYVRGSSFILKDVNYSLAVPDGSRKFAGWYLDEAFTEKADFVEGIPIESDMQLFAKFN